MAKVDKAEEVVETVEEVVEEVAETQEEAVQLQPLNETAFPEPVKAEIVYTGSQKVCKGNASRYVDNAENFPKYITPKGEEKNCYSKDFLDAKVKSGNMEVSDGVYRPIVK